MATIDVTTFATGAPPPEKYRYYVCELKWNAWECKRNENPNELYIKSNDALVSQLIPINKQIPKFFDPLILSYKTQKPVKMRTW